jgi:hypothetical protein
MPPKQRITVQPASRRNPPPSNYFTAAYQTIMSEDNRSVVISVAMFAVSHLHTFLSTDRASTQDVIWPIAFASASFRRPEFCAPISLDSERANDN